MGRKKKAAGAADKGRNREKDEHKSRSPPDGKVKRFIAQEKKTGDLLEKKNRRKKGGTGDILKMRFEGSDSGGGVAGGRGNRLTVRANRHILRDENHITNDRRVNALQQVTEGKGFSWKGRETREGQQYPAYRGEKRKEKGKSI